MLRSAGDVFTPTLKTLKGVAVPIEIEDLQDGRYRVTYQPEQKTYIVDVLFNNEVSIRNVPVTVTFGKAAQCVLNDGGKTTSESETTNKMLIIFILSLCACVCVYSCSTTATKLGAVLRVQRFVVLRQL